MKNIIYSLMILLTFYLLAGCDSGSSNQPYSATGNWQAEKYNILLTTNEAITIIDLYGQWEGELSFGETVCSQMTYYKDNVFGNFHFISEEINIEIANSGLLIGTEGETYTLQDNYSLDLHNGILQCNGISTSEDGTKELLITGSLAAPKVYAEPGSEVRVTDGISQERFNIYELNLSPDFTSSGKFLDIDMIVPFEGYWHKDSDKQITLNFELPEPGLEGSNSYAFIRNEQEMKLIQQLENFTEYEVFLNIEEGTISSLRYETVLRKRELTL